jgi:hypothetical protein
MSEFIFLLRIDSGKATNGIEKAFFEVIYKNDRFFKVTLLFEVSIVNIILDHLYMHEYFWIGLLL